MKKVYDLTSKGIDEILAFVRGKRFLEENIVKPEKIETKEYYDYSKGEWVEFEVKA